MKKLFASLVVSLLLLLSISTIVSAQVSVLGYTPFAYERLTATPVGLLTLNQTYALTAGAVFITVETNNIRYRIDNGNPSAVNGHLIVAASYQNLWFNDSSSIKWFKAIGIAGNSTLHITYYRRN